MSDGTFIEFLFEAASMARERRRKVRQTCADAETQLRIERNFGEMEAALLRMIAEEALIDAPGAIGQSNSRIERTNANRQPRLSLVETKKVG